LASDIDFDPSQIDVQDAATSGDQADELWLPVQRFRPLSDLTSDLLLTDVTRVT